MTSPPRTLAILLLACALAGTASAAPTGSFEESASAASDEISSRISELSETLRSSLTPELRSALVERFAPGRPEPHVRGRSLAAENICIWEQGDEDYDFAYLCNLQPSVVNNFKPASIEGRTGLEILMPIVTCLDIKLEDECKMKPSCIWYPAGGRFAEATCDGDFGSILTTPTPANSCSEADKVDETMMTLFTRESVACQKFPTESECNNAKGLSCAWQVDGADGCSMNGISFVLDLIRNSAKDLHMVVALGRQADTCAAKTSSGDCAGVSGCSWNSGTSLCDVADATVKSIVGVETLAGVFSTWNTCQIKSQSQCDSDANCKWANGNCELTNAKAGAMLVDGMADGAFKTFISDGTYCTNSRASDGTASGSSLSACYSNGRTKEDGSTLGGQCWIYGDFYHMVAGKYECFYWPDDPWFTNILNAPYPGYDKRCPNVFEQVTVEQAKCQAVTTEAECGTGDYTYCKWEGSCDYNFDNIWKLVVGEEDGTSLISIIADCSSQTTEVTCGAFERDIDFFALKYPAEAKVKATLGFAGLDTMSAEMAAKIQASVAAAVGGDVKAEEIAIKGVQFPVESKIELSISKSDVDADLAAFETKFKTGLALDLGVLPSDIVIKYIKDAARRRRSLLSSHVEIDYEVDGAPDAVRAQAIAKEVASTGGLATLKSETGAEATVPAGTTPTYQLVVEVEPKTSDPDGTAARLDAATITVDGVTATHETNASSEKEKKDDTFPVLVIALICAGIVLLIAVLVCCVVLTKRRARFKVSADTATKPADTSKKPAGKDVEKA